MGRIGIVGAGAVGAVLAARLSQHGHEVLLVGRTGPVTSGVAVVDAGKDWYYSPANFDLADAEILFFTVKAYALNDAVYQWLPQVALASPMVILCNGYLEAVFHSLAKVFPGRLMRRGVVMCGARHEAKTGVCIATEGEVFWGGGAAAAIEAEISTLSGFNYLSVIDGVLHRKWLVNTVLNTLMAAYGLEQNRLALNYKDELYVLVEESCSLGKSLWPDWSLSCSEAFTDLEAVVLKTAANFNSMAADILQRRPTEVAYLSGLASAEYPNLYRLTQLILSRSEGLA